MGEVQALAKQGYFPCYSEHAYAKQGRFHMHNSRCIFNSAHELESV